MSWIWFAAFSALAAGATAVLAKVGLEGVPSNLATAIRSVVIVVFAWALVLARGETAQLSALSRRSLGWLVLSGCATGLSWLAYFHALKVGPASGVAAIDKLGLAVTVVLAVTVLGEPWSWRLPAGVALMIAGALLATAR